MKIGIITFHYNLNCGAILQAYALQTQLEKMGHEVEFIDYRPKSRNNFKSLKRRYLSKSVKIMLTKWKNEFYRQQYAKKDNYNAVIKQSKKRYQNIDDLRKSTPVYDLYICGSDQIWNLENKTELPYAYLLDFGDKKTPRIAFAASMNKAIIPHKLISEFKNILLQFSVISVREQKSFDVVSKLLGDTNLKISQVHDPTFLLHEEDYKRIFDSNQLGAANVISYILSDLDPQQLKAINKFVSSKALAWINMRNPNTCVYAGKGIDKIVSPYQWLSLIYNSEYVICSSFHAVVFSLLFHKNFVVVIPKQQFEKKNINPRIQTILEPMGLIDRCISTFDDNMLANSLTKPINWKLVDTTLNAFREKGIEFLNSNLQ